MAILFRPIAEEIRRDSPGRPDQLPSYVAPRKMSSRLRRLAIVYNAGEFFYNRLSLEHTMANLPPWGQDELPEPLPYSLANAARTIGPGAILLVTAIGAGEWLIGPANSVKYGVDIMWIATVGILLQVMFNLEAIRYTLYTGEPILSGIMRLWPGANFWGTFYVVLATAQLGIPALALSCASVVFAFWTGKLPAEDGADSARLILITYGILALTVIVLSMGGTVERMLERVSWLMIAYIFTFLIFVNLAFVTKDHSWQTFRGFFRFGEMPSGVDWLLLASLAATAGSGGIGNLTITNWVRDKGMGMGGRVGAIPSAVGGKNIDLSHNGKVFALSPDNLGRWRTWWKYIVLDQVWLWGIGCFLGMYLNVNLATAIMPVGENIEGPAAGAYQAEFMATHMWKGLWYLGLLNGFWILFSTQLGNTDILVRTIADVVWVASTRVRQSKRMHIGRIYFLLLIGFTIWGGILVNFGSAVGLFKILAFVAGLLFVPASLQILRVNTTLLPVELRPSWWRRVALVACAIFYAAVTALVLWDKLA